MATKVKKAIKAAKPKKQIKKKKPLKPKITGRQIYDIISETLQHNSDGEFDLPSVMVRYLEKSDPRSKLGLHREFYIVEGKPIKFHSKDSDRAMEIYRNQASITLSAVVGEGVPVREKRFNPPFCRRHR